MNGATDRMISNLVMRPPLCRRGDKDDLRLNLVDRESDSCSPHKSPKSDTSTQRVPKTGKKNGRCYSLADESCTCLGNFTSR